MRTAQKNLIGTAVFVVVLLAITMLSDDCTETKVIVFSAITLCIAAITTALLTIMDNKGNK